MNINVDETILNYFKFCNKEFMQYGPGEIKYNGTYQ